MAGIGAPANEAWNNCKPRSPDVPLSERRKEIKRRRHRRKKVSQFARKLSSATVSERVDMAKKLRSMTPGGQAIVEAWDLEKR